MKTLCKGIWVGATMTVPGVSGGTMAMIMGVYSRLMDSVNNILKKPWESIKFLLQFGIGGIVGVVLFARFITTLLEDAVWGIPLQFFFVGAVAGGVPLIFHEAGIKKFSYKLILYPVIGILLVSLLSLLPDGIFSSSEGISGILLQFVGGIVIAVALVLPGISASQMLCTLGIYETVMLNISNFHILSLLPLAIGVFVGIFLSTGVIGKLLERFPLETYLIILGFVAGSVWELLPKGTIGNPILCVIGVVIGACLLYLMSRMEIKGKIKNESFTQLSS